LISVLGLSLEYAIETLENYGYAVQTIEVRSRKGIKDGQPYIVRQIQNDNGVVELAFSVFMTEPNRL